MGIVIDLDEAAAAAGTPLWRWPHDQRSARPCRTRTGHLGTGRRRISLSRRVRASSSGSPSARPTVTSSVSTAVRPPSGGTSPWPRRSVPSKLHPRRSSRRPSPVAPKVSYRRPRRWLDARAGRSRGRHDGARRRLNQAQRPVRGERRRLSGVRPGSRFRRAARGRASRHRCAAAGNRTGPRSSRGRTTAAHAGRVEVETSDRGSNVTTQCGSPSVTVAWM
jgi:hypothetical protein